jgi:hypothetical protein
MRTARSTTMAPMTGPRRRVAVTPPPSLSPRPELTTPSTRPANERGRIQRRTHRPRSAFHRDRSTTERADAWRLVLGIVGTNHRLSLDRPIAVRTPTSRPKFSPRVSQRTDRHRHDARAPSHPRRGDDQPSAETISRWWPHTDHPTRQPTRQTVIVTAEPVWRTPVVTSFDGAERATMSVRGLLPSLPLRVHLRRHKRKSFNVRKKVEN